MSSRVPLLQPVNYVLIVGEDFRSHGEHPHGLLQMGFDEPQLYTTVLPQLINLPILRAFFAPMLAGMQGSIILRGFLNGIALTHQLVECSSGFYLRVNWGGHDYLIEHLEQIASAHMLQLHEPQLTITGVHLQNRGFTAFIPGGTSLVMSRKLTLIGPSTMIDVDHAIRNRYPDLAQENFGFGRVHASYFMMEPRSQPGWDVQLVIPVMEDDYDPVVLFKAVIPPYEGLGAIYVPKVLNKFDLIVITGLDLVCGPHGDLCECYHNGRVLRSTLAMHDLDFLSCWLDEQASERRDANSIALPCDINAFTSGTVRYLGARS